MCGCVWGVCGACRKGLGPLIKDRKRNTNFVELNFFAILRSRYDYDMLLLFTIDTTS